MYRYVALIWNPAESAAGASSKLLVQKLQASAGAWERVVQEDNTVLFHSGVAGSSGDTRVLANGAGAICGTLFPRDVQDADASKPLVILERCWGRYVALFREPRAGVVRVLRDPTGTLPCFVTRHEGVHIVFSDIEICIALGLRFSINWQFIAAYVPYSALQIRATGLNEVTELQPGECLTFEAERMERKLLWNPLDAPRRGLIEDPAEAAAAVRGTVRECVHAWAAVHRSQPLGWARFVDRPLVLEGCAQSSSGDLPALLRAGERRR
jgi:asparagine synthase (glutamine-hydrolysing)